MRISQTGASRFLLVLIVIIFAAGIIFAVLFFRSNPVEDAINANRVINVLFIIEYEKKPLCTYVLMYYPGTKRAAIFDIPGELGLLLTRINRVDRIDRVYDPSRINNYEREIEKLLGDENSKFEIDFSIVITKENLVSIVDLLEGVEIFIPSAVSYRDDDKVILFPSGMTVLDGDKAGVYATYSLEDEEREMEVFRRQRFFTGFLNRQIQMNERLKNPDAAKLYYSFFKTNMNQRTLMFLFDEFVYIDTDRTSIRSVEGTLREVSDSDQMLIIPLRDGKLVKEVVSQTLGALTREVEVSFNERSVTIEVLNGTAVNGLAGRTADMLRNFGYDVISIGNADDNNYERTEIIYRSADEMMIKDFTELIRCGNIRSEIIAPDEFETVDIQDFEYKADLTLIIGRDFDGRYVSGN